MQPKFANFALIFLFFYALSWNWGKPALSSHLTRQTQTAQTAQIFTDEGFDLLHPKVHYFNKPGYTVLEFPFYQTLMAVTAQATQKIFPNVPMETALVQWGRIMSLISALFFLIAFKKFLEFHSVEEKRKDITLLLLFSSPLLLGLSQWVTIETMNLALAAWALIAFIHRKALWFFVLAACSLLIKPTFLFCLSPFFLENALANRKTFSINLKAWLALGVASILSALTAYVWYKHGENVNTLYKNPYGLSFAKKHYFDIHLFEFEMWKKILGRTAIYLIGPLTLLLFFKSKYSKVNASLYIASFLSIFAYLLFFQNLNFKHNYYQLPLLFPFFIIFALSVKFFKTRKIYISTIVLILIVNIGISSAQLTKNDESWTKLLAEHMPRIPKGGGLGSIAVHTNTDETYSVLGFYTGRYLQQQSDLEEIKKEQGDWAIVCDNTVDSDCANIAKKTMARCAATGQDIGKLWICSSFQMYGRNS